MNTLKILLTFILAVVGCAPAFAQISQMQEQYLATKDYAVNGGFENGKANWKAYADANSPIPTDCSGGVPTTSISTTTLNPIQGKSSGLFNKPASNVQGQGYATSFALDKAARTKMLTISGSYEIASGTYSGGTSSTDSDLEVYLYDVDGAQVIQPAGYKLNGGVSDNTYEITATFQAPQFTTTVRNFRLCLHHSTSSANAFTLRVDQFKIQVQTKTQGASITGEIDAGAITIGAVTTAPTKGTIAVDKLTWHREGKFLVATYRYSQTAAGSAGSGDYLLSLPAGLQVDTTLVPVYTGTISAAGVASSIIGSGASFDSGPRSSVFWPVLYSSTQFRLRQDALFTAVQFMGSSTLNLGIATVNFTVEVRVPIVGWDALQTLSDQADTRPVGLIANTASGAANSTTSFKFTNVVADTHGAYSTTTGAYTVPVPGLYQISASITFTTGQTNQTIQVRRNGTVVFAGAPPVGGANQSGAQLAGMWQFNAGDVVDITYSGSGAANGSASTNYFMLNRISGPSQIAASEGVAARYSISAGASTAANVQFNFDTRDFDTHLAVTTGAGAFKFTAPVSGTYRISANIYLSANATILLYKNGSIYSSIGNVVNGSVVANASDEIRLNAGDYIDVRANATATPSAPAGATVQQSNYILIRKVGN